MSTHLGPCGRHVAEMTGGLDPPANSTVKCSAAPASCPNLLVEPGHLGWRDLHPVTGVLGQAREYGATGRSIQKHLYIGYLMLDASRGYGSDHLRDRRMEWPRGQKEIIRPRLSIWRERTQETVSAFICCPFNRQSPIHPVTVPERDV